MNQEISSQTLGYQFNFKGHKILIVDDNPINLSLIVDYLEDFGLTVLVSQDGESSIKRAKYAQPSIILLDVLMPGIDGYETCSYLKKDPQTKNIPIIFMTALSRVEDKVRGFEVGAVDYITKPIQPEEVLVRIKLHLQLRHMTTTLAKKNQILHLEIEQRKLAEIKLKKSNKKLQKEINEKISAQQALKQLNEQLEHRIEKRTIQLTQSNNQLRQEIIERRQAEERVRNSLAEKEILLKEIYHRVKNNLLVVSSLLEIQSASIQDPEIIKIFQNSQHRIQSMALIHEQLYQSQNLKEIDLSIYLQALVQRLSESYDLSSQGITLNLETDSIFLNLETANSCGLIVNELIANSFEHAFPNQMKGNITLSLKQDETPQIVLKITDNGVGFPANFDVNETESLGLKLVRILTRQLEGELKLDISQGTCFEIIFSELDYCDRI